MAFAVHIQNFQSIKDATLEVDGFTVISGRNNSGKTAIMRAVRAVFTNPPVGAFLRHGCEELSVEIRFDDGNWVKWEKDKKGRAKYTVNGVMLQNVGRSVPPEVLALGVFPAQAGGSKVWPQIAPQFTGQVFLLDLPGSALAEAISDVERVGRLNGSLKVAASDRKRIQSKLKIRREDLQDTESRLEVFEGLDQVGQALEDLATMDVERQDIEHQLQLLRKLRERQQTSQEVVASLAGVEHIPVPSSDSAEKPQKALRGLQVLRDLQTRWSAASGFVAHLEGAPMHLVPSASLAEEARETAADLHWQQAAKTRRDRVAAEVAHLSKAPLEFKDGQLIEDLKQVRSDLLWARTTALKRAKVAGFIAGWAPPTLPSDDDVQVALMVLREHENLAIRRASFQEEIGLLIVELEEARGEFDLAEHAVHEILGTRGACPVCGQEIRA